MQDKLFKVLLILSAIVIPVIGGGIIYSLTVDASGAFEEFGFWHFIFSDDWVTTAGKESYGALPFITGTLLTTALALLMCIPFSLPVALFTGEYFRGKKIAAVLGTVIDLLAGIPSITIPRTLAMSLYGDMDVSSIETRPEGRKPILTKYFEGSSMKPFLKQLKDYLAQGGQCYVICPLIEDNEDLPLKSALTIYEAMSSYFKGHYQTGLLYGSLKDEEKNCSDAGI